jgi:hypothetical protein
MLHLLLDEHLSDRIVPPFLKQCPGAGMTALFRWQDGRFMGSPDETLLAEACEQRLTLVTYDQSTIAPLLKTWGEQDVHHAGVVFIDGRTIPPNDIGGIARALSVLWRKEKNADWQDRVVYLTRGGG